MKTTVNSIMQRIIFFVIFSLCTIELLHAQHEQGVNYDTLLNDLEKVLSKGNKRSLRDLGSLIDKKGIDSKVRTILSTHTLFASDEMDLKATTRDEFLNFFYDNEYEIRFSEIIGAYHLKPISEHTSNFEIKHITHTLDNDKSVVIREGIETYYYYLKEKNKFLLIQHINSLAKLNTNNIDHFLLNELASGELSKTNVKDKEAIYVALINNLANHTKLSTLEIILKKIEQNKVKVDDVRHTLSKLTNVFSDSSLDNYQTVDFYKHLIDSLGTISAIRNYGYESIFNFKSNFFYENVDYFGKILCLSNNHPWITHNAYQDLLSTEDPKILYYLAAFIYKNRNNIEKTEVALYQSYFENLTQIKVDLVPKNSTNSSSKLNELDARQFLYYWSNHYDAYEWNSNKKRFTNKLEVSQRKENYEKLFRRLNSKNDTVALSSYMTLTEGEPSQIIELSKKYKPLLRNYNKSLPSSKNQYLERLVILTDFCRKNKIKYHASSEINLLLTKLRACSTRKDRYRIENEIIDKLTIEDLTALEYIGSLNSKSRAYSLSMGRILDWYYSKNWNTIINDPNQLRLYLKKADLFSTIGVPGICNAYLKKFDILDDNEQYQLTNMQSTETDEGILRQIAQVLTPTENSFQELLTFEDFLAEPNLYNKVEIKILPPPNNSKLKLITRFIQNSKDTEAIKNLFLYLSYHQSIEMVPYLYELIDEKRVLIKGKDYTVTIGDRTVPILEDIYDYSFAKKEDKGIFTTDKWRSLWHENKKNYKKWRKQFYGLEIKKVIDKETLAIDDLNNLLESPDYDVSYKETILKLLHRVKPLKDIRKLRITPLLSIDTDLVYFKDLDLAYKQLDDIPKLFDVDNPSKMNAFLHEKSDSYDLTEKGAFYNNLFQAGWFSEYIFSGEIGSEMADQILKILEDYLNESDYVSEFEEQRTMLNIAQINNIGLSFSEKLEATLGLDADESAKAKIQEAIIARISYAELGSIADYLEYLSVKPGQLPYDFLHKDFGLPIFNLDEPNSILTFSTKHQQLSEFEFYSYYLKTFGVDFTDKSGDLDFHKIYDILSFDIVSPFVGTGGSKRDDYVYGIIKLLEIHFETRLGYHEKLNESQSFYTYTSSKRAKAWKEYIIDQHLIKTQHKKPPSFNHVRIDD